jgi:hypothetical protein
MIDAVMRSFLEAGLSPSSEVAHDSFSFLLATESKTVFDLFLGHSFHGVRE